MKKDTSQKNIAGIPVHDLEWGMPSLDEAKKRLIRILDKEKKPKNKLIKIIHGWGSSGVGGALRHGLRKFLESRKKEGKIKGYICGEHFSFNMELADISKDYPGLISDSDLNNGNSGITIILLL